MGAWQKLGGGRSHLLGRGAHEANAQGRGMHRRGSLRLSLAKAWASLSRHKRLAGTTKSKAGGGEPRSCLPIVCLSLSKYFPLTLFVLYGSDVCSN